MACIMTELGWMLFQPKTEPSTQSSLRDSHDPYIIDFNSFDDCVSFAKYCRDDFVVLKSYESSSHRIVERSKMHLYEGALVWPEV